MMNVVVKTPFTVLDSGDLYLVTMQGFQQYSLEEVKRTLTSNLDLELGLKADSDREVLAVFYGSSPVVDVRFVRTFNREASIAAHGLNEIKSKRKVLEILGASGFSPNSDLDSVVLEKCENSLINQTRIFSEAFRCFSERFGVGKEDIFAAIRYSSFLMEYRNMEIDRALGLAFERYEIPKNLS